MLLRGHMTHSDTDDQATTRDPALRIALWSGGSLVALWFCTLARTVRFFGVFPLCPLFFSL